MTLCENYRLLEREAIPSGADYSIEEREAVCSGTNYPTTTSPTCLWLKT